VARTFSAGTDKVSAATEAAQTIFSIAMWVWRVGLGGGGDGVMHQKAGESTFYNGSAGAKYNFGADAWSGVDGVWNVPSPATGAWVHVGIAYDAGATTNVPEIYLNGVLQTLTTIATPTGTWTGVSAANVIGNVAGNTNNWNGHLAEYGKWAGVKLNADQFAALAKGYTPLHFPNSLIEYIPMVRDIASYKNAAPTTVGTVVIEHPRTIMPSGNRALITSAAAAPSGPSRKRLLLLGVGG
jgi:hypothetical protein